MRILFIADINSTLLHKLIVQLMAVTPHDYYIYDFFKGKIINASQLTSHFKGHSTHESLFDKIKTAVRVICGVVFLSCKKNFDHIQIQYVHPYYGFFAWFILRKTSTLVTCLYGSDFYHLPEWKYNQQEKFYRRSTAISFTNEQMCEDFKLRFNRYTEKFRITRFGLDQLTEIDNLHSNKRTARKLLGLPEDRVIVVCGHSSNIRENHLKIIEQILLLKDEIKKQIYLVFPFTYNASDNLVAKITASLDGSGLDYIILTVFLSDIEVAALRVSTDIMINLPSSDQMTAAMLETLYAGGVVITGNWLPYKILDEKGISYIKIDEYFELVEIVQDITLTIKSGTSSVEKSHNRECISHMFRWEHCIEGWLNLLPT